MFGKKNTSRLPALLASLDPDAPLAERNLWIIEVAAWIRGAENSVEGAVARMGMLLDTIETDEALRTTLENVVLEPGHRAVELDGSAPERFLERGALGYYRALVAVLVQVTAHQLADRVEAYARLHIK